MDKKSQKRIDLLHKKVNELQQRLAGTAVQPVYAWEAYGSWPYGEMYVTQ